MIRWKESGKDEYVGCVLEAPVYHAQAFNCDYETVYARVWDGEHVKDVSVGTVSYGSSWYQADIFGVDATPEVIAKAKAYTDEKKRKEYAHAEAIRAWKIQTGLARGNTVKVVRGRKVAKGTIAVIEGFSTTYGPSVKINGQWTSGDNVVVIVSALPANLDAQDLKIWKGHEYEVLSEVMA